MDLDPHILQLEPPEYYHNLFGCCWCWSVTKSARLVAVFSFISFLVNTVLLFFSNIESTLRFVGESAILLIELGCIVLLFYGLSHKKPNYLKPYLLFGTIWNVGLIILLVLCLLQLFDQNNFRFDVFLSVIEFVELDPDLQSFESTSFWLTVLLIAGLAITIVVGFWFLHIVLTTYHYFVFRQKEIWDQQAESKQLLVNEPTVFIKKNEFWDMQSATELSPTNNDDFNN